jgi:hypothetical protein
VAAASANETLAGFSAALFPLLALLTPAALFRRCPAYVSDITYPQHVPEADAGPTAVACSIAGLPVGGLPVNQHPPLLPQPDPPRRCPVRIVAARLIWSPPDWRQLHRLTVPRVPFMTQVYQLVIESFGSAR